MSQHLLYLTDICAITVLALGMYFPRHRRKDLAIAFIAVNIGVLAVATILSASTLGAGVGLGLFGVLSIIRLRSAELSHIEVAYYFSSLALGLLGGLGLALGWVTVAFMGGVVLVMAVGDLPRFLAGYSRQQVVLEYVVADPTVARARLESLLHARVYALSIERIDMVNDMTVVDVRYKVTKQRHAPAAQHRRELATAAAAQA